MRKTLVAILVLAAQCQCQETLSLDQAIRLAVGANRALKISAIGTKKIDDQMAALRTKRLPALSVSILGAEKLTPIDFLFERGFLGVYPGVGPIPGKDISIHSGLTPTALITAGIGQPLTQQRKIKLNLQMLKLSSELSVEQTREQRHSIVNQVKKLYYGILQSQSALESIEESIKLYQELERITAQYVEQQAALKSQNLEMQSRLQKAEYDALAIRNPLETQKEQLNSLLARDIGIEFRVEQVPELRPYETELDQARKLALERRPELQSARIKRKQAEQDKKIKRAEYIPDVSLTANYLSPVGLGSLIPSTIATAGIQFSWEPYDWGRKKHELAEKDKTIEQAGLAITETENQLLIEVGMRYRKLEETRKLLTVARAGQALATENVRVATNRLKQESTLLKDVLQAQAAQAEANNQYRQALLAFWSAKADFEKAIGEE